MSDTGSGRAAPLGLHEVQCRNRRRVTVGERAVASPNGNHVRLLIEPGGSVVVGQAKGYATDRAKAFLFARVLRGSAAAALGFPATSRNLDPATDTRPDE